MCPERKLNKFPIMVDYSALSVYGKITYVFRYICVLIAVVGFIGNALSFTVLMRKKFKTHSFAYYLRIINIADTFVLFTSFRHFAAYVLDADLTLVADIFCRLGEYTVHVASSISVWHLFLITIDRFVNILYQQRFPIFKKRRFQAILSAIAVVYSFCFYIPLSLYYNLVTIESTDSSTNQTTVKQACVIVGHHDLLVYWTDLANLMTATFVLNNILTILIIINIYKSRQKFATSGKMSTIAVKDRKFAINSIALNVACFLCKTPVLVSLLLSAYLTLEPDQVDMLFTIGVSIYTIENSNTFFVNFFVNSLFYNEFMKVFSLKSLKNFTLKFFKAHVSWNH